MADVNDKHTRSYNMSRIKGKDTKPEMLVRKFLHSKGLRYSLHNSKLPGKPDLVFRKYNSVVFVNGCFWHGHKNCKYFVLPKTKTEWWTEKINNTKLRDIKNLEELTILGWKSIIVWECELKKEKRDQTLKQLFLKIKENKGNG